MYIILYIAFWYDVHVNEQYTRKYVAFVYMEVRHECILSGRKILGDHRKR